MSDTFNPDDFEGMQEKMATLPRREVRRFEADRKKLQEAESRLAEMERREAFFLAGIPMDNPASKYFVKGYDGDLSPDAIKAAAIEARILQGSEATSEEVAGHVAAQAAAAGGKPTSVAPDYAAKLAELSKKQFAPTDDAGRAAHIAEIARLAKEAGASIPIYPGT